MLEAGYYYRRTPFVVQEGETFHSELQSIAETARKSDRGVFVSAEILSVWDEASLISLKRIFSDFDITIVWAYREILSRLKSSWGNRATFRAIMTEGSFVIDQLAHYKSDLNRAFQLGSIFGIDNVAILDYYGILDAGADIAQVVLCEVVGVLCDYVPLDDVASVNSAGDMAFVALFDQVLAHAVQMSCTVSLEQARHLRDKVHADFRKIIASGEPLSVYEQSDLSVDPSAAVERPSTVSVPVDVLRSYAANLEMQFRLDTAATGDDGKEHSGITWYYSNVQANDRARAEVLLSEVDAWTLTNAAVVSTKSAIDRTKVDLATMAADSAISSFWKNWINEEVQELSKTDKYMSACFRTEKSVYHRVSQFDGGQ